MTRIKSSSSASLASSWLSIVTLLCYHSSVLVLGYCLAVHKTFSLCGLVCEGREVNWDNGDMMRTVTEASEDQIGEDGCSAGDGSNPYIRRSTRHVRVAVPPDCI